MAAKCAGPFLLSIIGDLSAFWREQYPKIKTALSRRYPRHEWR
jgi:ATP-dependent helicase HrpB